jgi:acyl-CoA thioesterase I
MKKLLLSRRKMLLGLVAFLIAGPLALLADAPVQTPLRVACVGDSITYGAGLKDRHNDSYPVWLGRWLGSGYDVRNFGHSGATLLQKGNLPYIKQKEHEEAIAFKPGVVVIMLGTNDSKHHVPSQTDTNNVVDNWQYKADYVADYEALIAEFRAANPAAKIYVCYPPPCFPGQWGIDDDTIHHEIIPMVRKVARKSDAKIIDMYKPFSGKKDLFPDTVHPNDEGAKLMATVVYQALTGKKAPANE